MKSEAFQKKIFLNPDTHPLLQEGRRVLALEANALNHLSDNLNDAFISVVTLLEKVKGRIIVTGMGKSGHIARKIAATLSSTGTPAYFVHPAEASHGDLGVIGPQDCLIVLSNSGETRELSDLIHYANRFSIPLVSITSQSESTLGQASQHVLTIPPMQEACSLNLVPTTSTTMMLALGDALAVTLLKQRGFTSIDFGRFHPGGMLGQRLIFVHHCMHETQELPLVPLGTSMREALKTITQRRFGCVGVIDAQGKLEGVITDGDIRRHLCEAFMDQKVESIMTQNPKVTYPDALAAEALGLMSHLKITHLFVVCSPENRTPLGIIHVHDCLKAGIM